MKIGFAVKQSMGLNSEVFDHFGSAPAFVVIDSEAGDFIEVENADLAHEHGRCNPVAALRGAAVDCVVVGGIGRGALEKLSAMGIGVYKAQGRTVEENLNLLKDQALSRFHPAFVCSGDCSHH